MCVYIYIYIYTCQLILLVTYIYIYIQIDRYTHICRCYIFKFHIIIVSFDTSHIHASSQKPQEHHVIATRSKSNTFELFSQSNAFSYLSYLFSPFKQSNAFSSKSLRSQSALQRRSHVAACERTTSILMIAQSIFNYATIITNTATTTTTTTNDKQ